MSFTKTQNKFSKGIDDRADDTTVTIDEAGNVGIGTVASSLNAGQISLESQGRIRVGRDGGTTLQLNRTTSEGDVANFYFDGSQKGSLAVQAGGISLSGGGNGGDHLAIDSSGNVGIGETNPQSRLHVKAAGPSASALIESTSNTNGQLTFKNTSAPTGFIVGLSGTTSGDALLYHGDAKNMQFWTNATERMRINSTGNVGIGTTSPTSLLSVGEGDVTTGSFNESVLTLQPGWTATSGLQSSTLMWRATAVDTPNAFHVDNTTSEGRKNFFAGLVSESGYFNNNRFSIIQDAKERLTVDTSGNLLVGTSTGTANLTVSGSASVQPVAEYLTGTAGVFHRITYGGNTSLKHSFTGSGGDYAIVNNTGGVILGKAATAWVAASDETLKENISDIGPVLDTIKDYQCVNYSLKATESDAADKVGFIAQDWENDFPNVVSKSEDGTLGMKYTETIPVLLKAIQEQQAMIEELKAEVAALKGA